PQARPRVEGAIMLDLSHWFRRSRRRPLPNARGRRTRPVLETLEDRTVPAAVNFDAATHLLQFTSDPGKADNVFVTAPAANQVVIQVTGADTLTLTGDAAANADF